MFRRQSTCLPLESHGAGGHHWSTKRFIWLQVRAFPQQIHRHKSASARAGSENIREPLSCTTSRVVQDQTNGGTGRNWKSWQPWQRTVCSHALTSCYYWLRISRYLFRSEGLMQQLSLRGTNGISCDTFDQNNLLHFLSKCRWAPSTSENSSSARIHWWPRWQAFCSPQTIPDQLSSWTSGHEEKYLFDVVYMTCHVCACLRLASFFLCPAALALAPNATRSASKRIWPRSCLITMRLESVLLTVPDFAFAQIT